MELIPEKKGLFLKHVEYEVSSQRFKSSVYRRYNDFVVFQEMLLHKFPYRMVPALPPKRMLGADREFIEARRRALKRFVNLVARHPYSPRMWSPSSSCPSAARCAEQVKGVSTVRRGRIHEL